MTGVTTVLHVAQPVDAGVPRVLVDLAAEQVARGWRVVVACPSGGWLDGATRGVGAEVEAWPARRSPGPGTAVEAIRLRRLVARTRPDVVHLHSAKAGLAGRLALRGRLPTVFQPHAWSFEAVDGALARASLAWERYAVRWTDLVVAVSAAERDEGERAGIRTDYLVARNGVDVEHFRPAARSAARAALGLGPQPLAVCVGRLARQKGQDALATAWPAVRAIVPDAELALVGEGPDQAALQALSVPGVTLHGPTVNPRAWYAAADVVVVPSRWEGMALVPLEAMACGRSVVAFDVAGVRESLGPGSAAGAVVATGDTADLVRQTAARLADPARAAAEGAAGRQRAVDEFDVRRTAATVCDTVAALVRV